MPFRAIAKMTGGAVDMHMVHGIMKMVNGHFFSGLGKVISGYFRNSRQNKAFEKELN
jgi:beta-glucosidase